MVGARRVKGFLVGSGVMALLLAAVTPVSAQLGSATTSTAGAACGGSGTGADGDCRNSSAFSTANTGTTFTSRYAWNINADTGALSTHDTTGTGVHTVTFSATAPGGYRLDIVTSRFGDIRLRNDLAGCSGSADTSGVTGSSNVAVDVNGSALSLGDPGGIGTTGTDTDVPISQTSATAQIFNQSNGSAVSHSLSFTWTGSVRSNSCEAAVRQGENSGSTTGCDACGYPGNPSRTQSSDGHYVTVTFTSFCGNGVVDTPGNGVTAEQCDQGVNNGSPGSCCNTDCTFRTAGATCRAAAGECDLAETCSGSAGTCPSDARKASGTACSSDGNVCTVDQCDGSSVTCQHPAGNAGTTCRAGSGDACDPAEVCTGVSTTCPADVVLPLGSGCRPAAGECDIAESCGGVPGQPCPTDAKKPSGSLCTDDGNVCTLDQCNGASAACQHPAGNAGSVCRAAAGICDVDESCTGTSTACPANAFRPSTTECRNSQGVCDPAESCTGSSAFCPADAKSSALCRASAGVCDIAESCDGVNNGCPTDVFRPSSFECRSSAGICDVPENCSGTGPACPADGFALSSFECRAAAGDCDVSESCTGGGTDCPNDAKSTAVCRSAAGDCDLAETCDGVGNNCPADVLVAAGSECRSSAGDCDVAETCDGSSPACPADAFASSSTECRASGGNCDPAESCTGTGPACPGDAKSTAVCRAATGDCDVTESCDGVTDSCPPDAVVAAGTTCRAATGDCDIAETCDGTSTACPADAVQPAGAECRASAGACDVAESCDGSSPACPADTVQPASVVCRSSAGDCDVPENCTGSSPACPADSVAGAFVQCRAAAGPCDQAENCTGSSPACPADALRPSTFTCRATAGSCDIAENCTGSSTACPTDVKSTGTCRASAGACDVAESCDGSSNDCPADALQPAGTTCRSATGVCDVAETCSGLSATCSPDATAPNGTPCNDNNSCTTPDTCQAGVCTGTPDPTSCADNFLCYKVKPAAPFAGVADVHLVDQFEDIHAAVRKAKLLCPPAAVAGGPVADNTTHLQSYTIKALSGTPKFVRRTNVKVTNDLGTLFVDAYKRDLLLVPANKNLSGPATPPNNNTINVDHYKCYKVKLSAGQAKFPATTVSVGDQFTSPPKSLLLKKIKHLCAPVDKNGEGIKNADAHLACYQAKPASGAPKHVRRTGVNTADQFGTLILGTIKESELCVPSIKTLP